MSLTPIEPNHIQAYVDRVYDDIPSDELGRVPLGHLYEALCETIVEHNESYTMANLTEEWLDTDQGAESFAEEKFDQIITEDTEAIIPIQHKHKWVNAVVHGLYELSDEHMYQDVPEKFRD